MVFSSLIFIFIFLPIVICIYYIAPKKLRNLVLFIASLIFYSWGEPIYITIMLFSTSVDYIHGLLVERYRKKDNIAKLMLFSSLAINLGLLCFFKYYDFFIYYINLFFGSSFREFKLPLPIGISFYTFQTMSYTIDVYRGKVAAQRNIINFGTYVSLFPQLIAGPIVLYNTVAEQLTKRKETIDSFSEGMERLIIGLGKKVLLANNIGLLWSEVEKIPPTQLTVTTSWLGIIAFAFQIYFDFSGYSDMAIGLGKIFGFTFPENFNYPYIAQSLTEFWRRWHMTLGAWFRDYLYIPLGGSREGKPKQIRNLCIVWFFTGLWHGASFNFILWGIYFGVIIILEKAFMLKFLNRLPKILRHIYCLILILIGWVLFSFENLIQGKEYLKVMVGFSGKGFMDQHTIYFVYNYAILLFILIIASTPILYDYMERLKEKFSCVYYVTAALSNISILLLSVAYLVDSTYNPFLYFRF